MFENAAKYLLTQIKCDPKDQAIIQQFLAGFAEHVLWNSTPATGSDIASFQGKTISEIVTLLPDMAPADRIEQVLRLCRKFIGSDISWLNDQDRAALEEYERFTMSDLLLLKTIAAKLGMEEDRLFIDSLLHQYHRSRACEGRSPEEAGQ